MNTQNQKGALARRMVTLDAKAFGDEGAGTLEGYASVKDSLDTWGDTIVTGAYINLDRLQKDGFVTFGHENSDCPVGYILEAKEDAKGLYVRMAFHGTQEAQDIRKVCKERMDAGKSVGLSIDFYPIEWEYKAADGGNDQIRVLTKIEVVGFAIVNLPAERRAVATSAKTGTGTPLNEQFESLLAELDDWTGRMEWIAANRKQGLTEVNRQRVAEIRSRLDALPVPIETPAESTDEVPLGAIFELEQFAESLNA